MKRIGIIIYTVIFIISCSSTEISTVTNFHSNSNSSTTYTNREIKWKHKEEKAVENADKDYKNPYKNHTFYNVDITSEYVDGKESKIKEDNTSQFIYSPSTNDVYIYEAVFESDYREIIDKSQEKMGKFDIKEIIENKKTSSKSSVDNIETIRAPFHARHVYFNFSNNNIASPYYSSKNDNTKTSVSGLYSITNNGNSLYSRVGIINMSFTDGRIDYSILNKYNKYKNQYLYNEKNKIINRYMSNLVFDKKYKNNLQLKIFALGNTYPDDLTPQHMITSIYSIMSPEMQKMSRSEVIVTKAAISYDVVNDKKNAKYYTPLFDDKKTLLPSPNRIIYEVDDKKYYAQDFSNQMDSQVIYLRSNTIAASPLIFIEKDIYSIAGVECENSKGLCDYINQYDIGSSFAAPKVTRVAYEIKKKYPFLTYHQVKQVILTTAKRDKTGYLSNNVGWGILDYAKAINGPSNFNAGLIDEQKFFLGMPDRIFDKEGNRYFYVDIPSGEYTFSNDITTGLAGDAYSSEVEEFYVGKDEKEGKKLQIPKVLDSEKLFYRNYQKAGLRKDGNGTLILTGLQDYDTKTQVLGGKLILKNDSRSKYEVFPESILEIDKENINIVNGIKSTGTVDFKTNTNVSQYLSKGKTILHTGKIVNANLFKTDGKIQVNKADISLEELKNGFNLVKSKNISISKLENTFLKPVINNNSLYGVIDTKNKKLAELSESELRNIPSYSINEGRFFSQFDKIVKEENPKALSLASNIINIKSDKKEIFSPIYNDYVSSIFEIKDDISSNVELNDLSGMIKDNKVSFRYLIANNIFEGDKYTKFSSLTNGVYLDYSKKLPNLIINPYLAYYYSKYEFKGDTDINSKNYKLGLMLNMYLNKAIISNNLGFSIIDTNLKRRLDEEILKVRNISYMISDKIKLAYNFEIGKFNIKPFVGYNLDLLKLSDVKEESKLGLNLVNNKLIKHSLEIGVNSSYRVNSTFNLNTGISYIEYINNDVKLNVNLLGMNENIQFVGRDILKRNLKFNFGFEKELIKKLRFKIDNEFDTNKKYRLNLEVNYSF
ncbi:S8 family serine peptidase [Oceanivirga miroungae]|uniref:Outer membrane autotransporter barrel domain-containing protein n=1 Tax=Oceanivirga miroungae TaxID=1130046 RepID=A0A6I8MDR5_9FUSO|nr:S8 family serine peptidase [Oceanivirga miroungae]VWL85231.1 outer membrane autotransporter barrel domain-containing protein [Oceanivirga miroungae]